MFLLTLMTVGACSRESEQKDSKLVALQAEMNAAVTQSDMNSISFRISQHLDQKLAKLEDLVRKDLDPGQLALFNKAATQWREYRETQADFSGDIYRGGSILPLILNGALSALTEERIRGLLVLSPEMIYREDGVGGWVE